LIVAAVDVDVDVAAADGCGSAGGSWTGDEEGVGEEGVEPNSGLDCWASFSGIEAGDWSGAVPCGTPPCFGGLVSCTLGNVGGCIGVATEVSGTEALRGDGGGWDGRV
jgi:hypothetical protein